MSIKMLGPMDFAIHASQGQWKPFPHLQLILKFLLYLVSGDCTRLMIFVPPRHGKSVLVSKYFLSWFLGTFPNRRVILATHSANFSARWGRQSKRLMEEYGTKLFPQKIELDHTSNASNRWDIKGYDGGLVTMGIGGAILGHGAHGFIIDDPTKGFKQANSSAHQLELNDWWYTEARTRLDKDLRTGTPPWVVYIAQRLGKHDLAGQILSGWRDEDTGEKHINAKDALTILQKGGTIDPGTWVVLNLPALAEEDDIFGRKLGEPLCSEFMNKEDLELIKRDMGSFRFESIYQGNPQEMEGTTFKREWFFDENGNILPHLLTRRALLLARINEVRYWDFASSGKKGDNTAGIRSTWNTKDQILTFRGLVHGKYSAAGVVDAYTQTTLSDGNNVRSIIEQEPGSASKLLLSQFRRDPVLDGFSIRSDVVRESKVDRAFNLATLAENGQIRFDTDAMTLEEIRTCLKELVEFTGEAGGRDDIVDVMTGTARYWLNRRTVLPPGRRPKY